MALCDNGPPQRSMQIRGMQPYQSNVETKSHENSHGMHHICPMAIFSPMTVFCAQQMLAMDSETSITPSLTPGMLLKAEWNYL